MSYSDCLSLFRTGSTGLSNSEAQRRQDIYGPNKLVEAQKPTLLGMFFSQFKDLMTLILLAATLISGLLGEYADAVTIIAIVMLNACLGLVQEYRAEKALSALKELAAPQIRVLRNGEEKIIRSELLVPGDIALLFAGDRVPADMRLGEVVSLEVEESALTGESFPVRKNTGQTMGAGPVPISERSSMIYFGTMITKGRAKGLVVATGMETEVGKIAQMMQSDEDPTPLQIRLGQLGKYLVAVCLLVCLGVVVLGVLKGQPPHQMFLAGVSLAVAAIPEGLPAIVTIVLALGVQRISRVKALVRKLPAVETLGSATVICSDKTGTLTCNEMNVREIYAGGQAYRLSAEGRFTREGELVNAEQIKDLALSLRIGLLCNNSRLQRGSKNMLLGDPTEVALLVSAQKAGLSDKGYSRLGEIPFESARRVMSVLAEDQQGKRWIFAKGAPDALLLRCSHYLDNGVPRTLTEEKRRELALVNESLASRGLRVLGMAYRSWSGFFNSERPDSIEREMIFVGLQGMHDPPRQEVRSALRLCMLAGIRVMMITGDHALTASSIAREIGMLNSDQAITGVSIENMNDAELSEEISKHNVFARVSPEHKLRIVKALRTQGHVVAMTGDGINDAPALREADIGVSMGLCGTEVAREASALVLQDDNFATIVEAVKEGRGIYDNIRKFIRYLLACNVGELLAVFLAMAVGLPLPLRPMQILWVNLVTDGLPAMALGVDQPDNDIMQRQPRQRSEGIFSRGLGRKILLRGVLIGLSTVAVFAISYSLHDDLARAQTMAFATLVMCQMFHVFDCRSERMGIAEKGLLSNKLLILAVIVSFGLFLVSIHLPPISTLFDTIALDARQWAIVMMASGLPTLLVGIRRAILYRFR